MSYLFSHHKESSPAMRGLLMVGVLLTIATYVYLWQIE